MSLTNTPVLTYPVAHDKNGGGGGGVTYMKGGRGGVPSNLYVNSINASLGNIKHLTTTSLSANDANFIYVTANDGNIYKLKGNNLDFYSGYIANLAADSISADSLDLKNLTAVKAYIEELVSSNITTKDLTVTGRAHFFELLIDKIRSVGGQIILSPTSCVIDYVEYIKYGNIITDPAQYNTADSFNVYWRSTDAYGRAVNNEWLAQDQAICQSFNNAHVGLNENLSNKKYWRKVSLVLPDKYINLTTGETRQTTEANTTTYNKIYMGMWDSIFSQDNQDHTNGITWTCAVQTIDGTPVSGVSYSGGTAQTGWAFSGTMNTSNKNFGVKITPSGEYAGRMTNKLKFNFEQEVGGQNTQTIPAKNMNVTVTFADDTFMYFPNVQAKKNNGEYVKENGRYVFEIDLSEANMPISIITVNSNQEVDWHLCHGIRLSNGSDAAAQWAEGSDCIPEAGDNLVQLGYQGTDDADRQSAIIISAYHSPDTALKAPSYAHYQGINDYDLDSHRGSYFDANGARFVGDITFANIGDLTAADKWMKLNYISAPIITTINEDTTRSIAPNTYNLSIYTTDSREFIENASTHEIEPNPDYGKTQTLYAVPNGYSLYTYLYDKNGILDYNVPVITSADANGGSLTGLTAYNAVEVSGVTKLVISIQHKLVKGNNPDRNVIDSMEIVYDEHKFWKTDSWCLLPEHEVAYATILNAFDQTGGTSKMNTQKVNLYVDFQYGVGHYKQGELINDAFESSKGLKLKARVYYQNITTGSTSAVLTEYEPNNITWTYSNNNLRGSFKVNNYLETLWPNNTNYQDYMKNYVDHRDKNPVMFKIELIDSSGETDVVLDSRDIYVSLQSGAVMKIMQNAIVSAVSSSKTYTDEVKTQLQNDISLVEQYADQISATVTSNYNSLSKDISDLSDNLQTTTEQLQSNITQTAGMIRSEVKRSYGKSSDRLVSGDTGVYTNSVDLTNTNTYREDRYYEVHIAPYTTTYSEKHEYVFQIERNLESNETYWGKPSYGKQDSPYGFELMYNLSAITDSQGKCNPLSMYVNEYYLNYVSNGIAIGTVNYAQSDGYLSYISLYMRGGSKYTVLTNQSVSVTIMPNNYIGYAPTEPVIYKPTMSSVEQTAERISMYVVETEGISEEKLIKTGIDIVNGKINLNADNTNINGNLNIYNANEGLQIYDSDNIPKVSIINKTLGSDPTEVTDYKTVSFGTAIILAPGVGTFDFANYSPAPYINLGEFKSDTIVTLSDFYWSLTSAVSDDGNSWRGVDVVSSTAYLRWTGPSTWSGSSNYVGNLPGLNRSFTADGSLETINFTEASGRVTGEGVTKYCMVKLTISGKVNYVMNTGVLVGKDGLFVSSSNGNVYSWIKSDNVILRNGKSIFRLKDGHIQRNDGSFGHGRDGEMGGTIFGDISSVVPYTYVGDTNYNVTNNDAFILVSSDMSTTRHIYLPSPMSAPLGKIIYIKNISPNPCVITTKNGYDITPINDRNPVSEIILENNKNNRDYIPRMFICSGMQGWMEFKCG